MQRELQQLRPYHQVVAVTCGDVMQRHQVCAQPALHHEHLLLSMLYIAKLSIAFWQDAV